MADEEIIRQNVQNVSATDKESFIAAIDAASDFVFKSYLPTSENCHFERYNYLCGKDKLGIVYDTKALLLTCTAKRDVMERVPFPVSQPDRPKQAQGGAKATQQIKQGGAKATRSPKQDAPNAPKQTKQDAQKAAQQAKKADKQKQKKEKRDGVQPSAPPTDAVFLEKPADKSAKEPKLRPLQIVTPQERLPQTKQEKREKLPQTKQAKQEKLPQVHAKREKLPQVKKHGERLPQVQEQADMPPITTKKAKDKPQKGKKGKAQTPPVLVQPILDKKTERSLKKLLPDAYDLLGAQSKKDFGAGVADIGNDKVRLSDYSVLLVPPYRALERFIYDLQQLRGISVKMIGQAYEKGDDGRHVLKQCYRKKAGVVYSEVMSALYAEYFANRNFYTHSDNTEGGESRTIADKATAKAIFDKLCEIVNYNAEKLKEIGVTSLT